MKVILCSVVAILLTLVMQSVAMAQQIDFSPACQQYPQPPTCDQRGLYWAAGVYGDVNSAINGEWPQVGAIEFVWDVRQEW